jgi:hypothetical protein
LDSPLPKNGPDYSDAELSSTFSIGEDFGHIPRIVGIEEWTQPEIVLRLRMKEGVHRFTNQIMAKNQN